MSGILDRPLPASVDHAQLRELLEFACTLAEAARPQILPHFRSPMAVHNKAGGGDYDPVTAADRGAETAMRELIRRRYPEHGIYGEEHGYERGASALTWVLDPLDGTRSFITGALHWGTLIALYDGQRPFLGVMDQPYTRERFVGSRLGAELRAPGGTTPLRTRPCADLAGAVLYCTSPAMFTTPARRQVFETLAAQVRLVRYGGDCYSYCMLAHGFVDLVVESSLAPYDVQALVPIIEAAGGVLTGWAGEPAYYGGNVVAAGDARIHAAALQVLAGNPEIVPRRADAEAAGP